MGDQNEAPLWEQNASIPEAPLRRPNPPISANSQSFPLENGIQNISLSSSNSLSVSQNSTPIRSNLSATAKEWYPEGYKKHSSVGDQLLKYKDDSQTNGICVDEYSETSGIVEELQRHINVLIKDPGQFDVQLGQILGSLAPYYSDAMVLSEIAKLIFDEAVAESNFRYSAARLCRILEEQSPFFKTALRLYAETKVTDVPPDWGCNNLTLTLAELFAQSDCDTLYGNCVLQGIEKIVLRKDRENIKCVCQVLKLTGAGLDVTHRIQMDSIFQNLKILKPTLPDLSNLIDYVITLRNSNWGQTDTNNYSEPANRLSVGSFDGAILFGPDGVELSEDEKQFLSENCFEYFSDELLDSDPDGLFDPDNEMDEEVHAAFREFTKANRE